jgi:signal transduction histidine kinase
MADKRRFQWWGFTPQLFLILVLPLTVLVLAVAFGSQMLHHDAMRSLVGDRDLRTVQAAANSLEQEIAHRTSTIKMLANAVGNRTGLDALASDQEEISASFDSGIALFSPSGQVITVSGPANFWPNVNISLPGYLASVAANPKEPVYSLPLPVPNENKTIILVGTATENHNILIGAFTPALLIQDTLSSFVGTGQLTAIVVGKNAAGSGFEVLYRAGPEKPDEQLNTHPGIQESLNGESGINYYQSSGGEHVVAFNPIRPIGWGLVIEEAWEDIASPYLNSTQAAPLAIVPVFLLALVALWFGARRIVQPLRTLEKQASALAQGDFEAIQKPVGGIDEIRNLQAELIDMAEKLDEAQESLHSYIGSITAGVENERRSLARELHDDTIQALIALNQRIQLASMKPQPAQKDDLLELQNLTTQAMQNLRRMVRGLRPIYLEELGLVASLEMLTRETSQQVNLPVSYKVSGLERRLDPQVEMALYRMVQESLNNVIHHSEAAEAWVEIIYSPETLSITIRDNGKGFKVPVTPAEFAKKGHFGLLGLHERAELLGATLDIISTLHQGTLISIHLKETGTNHESK